MLVANTSEGWKGTRILKHGGHTRGLYCSSFIQMLEWKLLKLKFFPKHQVHTRPFPQHLKFGRPSFPSCYVKVHIMSPVALLPPPLLLQPEVRICLYSMKTTPHNPPELALLLLSTTFGWVLSLSAVFPSSSPSAPPLHCSPIPKV